MATETVAERSSVASSTHPELRQLVPGICSSELHAVGDGKMGASVRHARRHHRLRGCVHGAPGVGVGGAEQWPRLLVDARSLAQSLRVGVSP